MTLLVLYICLTVFISFFCSMLEATLLSVSPAYIAMNSAKGKKFAILLQRYTQRIDGPLTSILTLNTFANMLGAASVGAQSYKVFGDASMAAASVGLTFLVLIFGEIVPKTLGATKWKSFAPMAAFSIRFLILVTYPFVTLTETIYRKLGIQRKSTLTREEVIVTAEMGANEGLIRHKESTVIRNVLKLEEITVNEIMTPRSVVDAIPRSASPAEIMEKIKATSFSRLPVMSKNFDNVIGLIHKYKVLQIDDSDNFDLQDVMTPIHKIPESISVAAALDQFVKRKEHLFLVVDDYGTPVGIVTLEDTIETLLGVEIVDESDSIVDMRKHALEKWRLQKKMPTPHVHI